MCLMFRFIESIVDFSNCANKYFNPKLHPGHVAVSVDKTHYDECLCLVASNKQHIYLRRSQTSTVGLECGQLLSGWGFVRNKSATIASSWVEDEYGSVIWRCLIGLSLQRTLHEGPAAGPGLPNLFTCTGHIYGRKVIAGLVHFYQD